MPSVTWQNGTMPVFQPENATFVRVPFPRSLMLSPHLLKSLSLFRSTFYRLQARLVCLVKSKAGFLHNFIARLEENSAESGSISELGKKGGGRGAESASSMMHQGGREKRGGKRSGKRSGDGTKIRSPVS